MKQNFSTRLLSEVSCIIIMLMSKYVSCNKFIKWKKSRYFLAPLLQVKCIIVTPIDLFMCDSEQIFMVLLFYF